MPGWMGKLLRINLTKNTSTIENIELEVLKQYLGGRGLGAKLLSDEVKATIDPLSSENKLIFTTGPLTGTKIPYSNRFTVTSKSPITGTIFAGTSGGDWAVDFKKCGYDALVIEGRSENPVYIVIKDQEVTIKDAAELWGHNVWETTESLTQREGKEFKVTCIGPAGENLVKYATISNDKFGSVGRGGLGAVMGSKNLKAILVHGKKEIQVAEPEKLDFVFYEAQKWISANPITSQGLTEFGSPVFVKLYNRLGMFPTRNFQQSQFAEIDKISGETIAESITLEKAQHCSNCDINCHALVQSSRGPVPGPDLESLWALGADCGVGDLTAIVEANTLCSQLGLDPVSTGATMACAMELAQREIIKEDLQFGDGSKFEEVIEKIAFRQGFGNELAEGALVLAKKYNSEDYAMHVKGLELSTYDPRGAQGMGLGFATSNHGGTPANAFMVGPEVLGVPKMIDRFAYAGKAGLTIYYQNSHAATDSLVLCRYIGLAISDEYFARLLSAVVGINYQPQHLHIIGERIWTLEKMFNLKTGHTATDNLPKRLLNEEINQGTSKGSTVKLEPMLQEYYRFRGWDSKGIPTAKKLAALGLEGYDA